ncbi:MAG TPA: hypothetical protein VJS19_04900 [Candidatus Dormibacteraeota bacterium]|nr:hypothetical protein [Candidatus Dormibacteraeota bacterium]
MRFIVMIFAAAVAAGLNLVTAPLHAEAAIPSYQLTVTESASAITTDQSTPSFRASLVPPAGDPSLNPANFYISIGSMNEAGGLNTLSPPYNLYFGGLPPFSLTAGTYDVVAKYQSPNYGLLTSAPVTLTVSQATPTLTCNGGGNYTYAPGAPITIGVDGVGSGAFTAHFAGPENLTSSVQQLDSNHQFTVSAPTVPGNYSPSCEFQGSATYAPASAPFNNRVLTVSASHPVGGIRLYTNPAPLVPNTPTTWQVDVIGQPGLPAPTGNVSITIGNYFIRPLLILGPGGTATVQLTSPNATAADGIQVVYMGDTVYADSFVHLYTTQPIPGRTASGATPSASSPTVAAPAAAAAGQSVVSDRPSPSAGPDNSPLPLAGVAGLSAVSRIGRTSPRNLAVVLLIAIAAIALGATGFVGVRWWKGSILSRTQRK